MRDGAFTFERSMPQIQCPACEAVYDVSVSSLIGGPRKVRCAACKTLWLAAPPEGWDEAETAHGAAGPAAAEPADNAQPLVTGERPVAEDAEDIPPTRPWHERYHAPDGARAASRWPALALAGLAAAAMLTVGLRRHVVAALPETGVVFAAVGLPVNLRGLELTGVKSGLFTEGGVELLVVQGEIANVSGKAQAPPPLRFSVRDARGAEIYAWTAASDVRVLEPGAKAPFRRRLASPPAEGTAVLVRFDGMADKVAARP